jgi:non-specific serine/threonine protein kinase
MALAAADARPAPPERSAQDGDRELGGPEPADAGPLLDAAAKEAYRLRLDDLREDVEEAESFNDPERAARAREEIEFLQSELAGAVGLGGRDRKAASNAERARVSVTKAIRATIKRIHQYDPVLARELETTVRTGTFCVHEPDPRHPLEWKVEPGRG